MAEVPATAGIAAALVRASVRTFAAGWRQNLLRVAGSGILIVSEATGVLFLLSRFDTISGWSAGEVLLLLGVADAGLGIGMLVGEPLEPPNFSQLLRDGRFDTVLTRPLSPWLWVVTTDVQVRNLGRILAGLVLAATGGLIADVPLGPGQAFGVAAATVLCGVVVVGVLTMGAALTMWTVEGTEVLNAFTYGGATVAGWPLDIYQRGLQLVFVWIVPIGAVVFVPVQAVTGAPTSTGSGLLVALPVLVVAFTAAAAGAWRLGLARYSGAGA